MPSTFDDIRISGELKIKDTGIAAQTRASILTQDNLAIFPVPLTSLRVWDAMQTNLPGTAATDDLAIIGGTFGTAPPMIQAGDLKNAGATTRYARFEVSLPECYQAAETVVLSLSAGMKTTVASVSCTVDIECYRLNKISGIGSDLCATSAISINSLTFAARDFTITSASLSPGDMLDVRVTIACNDSATATAVIPTIAAIDLCCDIKG